MAELGCVQIGDHPVLDRADPFEHLIWAATANIAILCIFGMVPPFSVNPSFTITDFRRWWGVHLRVEQSFEFFAAAVGVCLLMGLGPVFPQPSQRLAARCGTRPAE